MRALGWIVFLTLLPTVAEAHIWQSEKKPDPFTLGADCEVPAIVSWGSYVFDWPSKFDLVFSPHMELFAKCRRSGYVSFIWDFDELMDTEKSRIAPFLTVNPWQDTFDDVGGFQNMLDQMEAIYDLRNLTLEDRAYLYRVRAWHWLDDPKADEYRSRALEVHKQILDNKELAGSALLENLYVAGFYSWRLGDKDSAEDYFTRLQNTQWTNEDGEAETGSNYLEGLIDEIRDGKADDDVRFKRANTSDKEPMQLFRREILGRQ